MNIYATYTREFARQLILKYLVGGEIPTRQLVEATMLEMKKKYPRLGEETFTESTGLTLKPRKELYLEDWQSFVTAVRVDLKVLRDSIISLYEQSLGLLATWDTEFKSKSSRLTSIENMLDYKLLLEEESGGFFEVVRDDFSTTGNIGFLDRVDINTSQGIAHLSENPGRTYSSKVSLEGSRIALEAQVVGRGGTLVTMPGFRPGGIIDPSSNGWSGYIYNREAGVADLAVVVSFPEKKLLNRVTIEKLSPQVSDGEVFFYLSSDDVNWHRYEGSRSMQEPWIFPFEAKEVKAIRITLRKTSPDAHQLGEGYYYNFSIKEIIGSLDMNNYLTEGNPGVLISKEWETQGYSSAALEACEFLAPGLDISYWLSNDGTNWFPINPTNREPGPIDYVVRFSSDKNYSNIDESVNQRISETEGDTTRVIPVREEYNISLPEGIGLINYRIPIESESYVNKSSIKVFGDFRTAPSATKVEGWKEVPGGLESWIYAEEDTNVDVGPAGIKLNGEVRKGMILLRKGWQRVEIKLGQYSFTEKGKVSEFDLINSDPLYPYNMKHIFEGYQYPPSFIGTKVYNGFKKRAGFLLTRRQSIPGLQSSTTPSWYLLRSPEGSLVFAVNKSQIYSSSREDSFLIEYGMSSRLNSRILLKALFHSEVKELTPILSSYSIKLGY